MEILTLVFGLFFLVLYYVFEKQNHNNFRKKIPLVIHINGTRGKSSVTRLIAAGLRKGGKKTIAKTTGSAPRIILENGDEIPIVRYLNPNIKEQLKIFRFAAKRNIDALILECMAITPEYQWITEHKMIKSNIGVITNVRPDHLDLMGPGLKNVAFSLCNTLPKNGIAFTCEEKLLPLMQRFGKKRNTNLELVKSDFVSEKDVNDFSYIEHKENVAIALKICEKCNVPKETAIKGMKRVNPDIGAAKLFKIKIKEKEIFFINIFAANDPESTQSIIKYSKKLHPNINFVGIILNTRADRLFRSKQLIRMLKNIQFDFLYLIGEQTSAMKTYARKHKISSQKIVDLGWIDGKNLEKEIKKIKEDKILLSGIGNMGGNGKIIVDFFKERNIQNV